METKDSPKGKSNVNLCRQLYGAVTASITIFIAAFWTMYISPVLLKFSRQEMSFTITESEKSWIVSIMDFGNFLSPIIAGYAMDKFGRKRALILSAFIFIASSIFVLNATSGQDLFMGRLLAGIGKGFAFTVTPIYVAEFSSKNIRGALTSFFYLFFCIGTAGASCIGPYVTFKTLNIVSLVLPLVFLVMVLFLPESPYYYVAKEKHAEAHRALSWYRKTTTYEQRIYTDDELEEIVQTFNIQTEVQGGCKELFVNKIFRKALIIVTMTGLAQRFGGISYMLSFGASDLPFSGTWFGERECFVVFCVVSIVANIIPTIYVDTWGRKPILLFSSITTFIGQSIGAVYFTYMTSKTDTQYFWIPYIVVIFFAFSFTSGLGIIPATLQGEMFPAMIKRYASAMVTMFLSLGSFFVNLSHYVVVDHFGVAGNYYISALSCLIFSIYFIFYVFETKGKTLKEIQDSLMKKEDTTKTPNQTT